MDESPPVAKSKPAAPRAGRQTKKTTKYIASSEDESDELMEDSYEDEVSDFDDD